MKRYLIALGFLCLALSSCGKAKDDFAQAEESTATAAVTTELTTLNNEEKYYAADGTELKIRMSQYSENARLLTADDIYLLSYDCGYISGARSYMLIIEDDEQLCRALEGEYSLALPPEGLTEDELWHYNTAISEPFNKMTAEYPVSEYSYVVEYIEVGSGGYYIRSGALLEDGDKMFFVWTADSKTPAPDTEQSEVMGGFCHMAAVPKDALISSRYEGWTYP